MEIGSLKIEIDDLILLRLNDSIFFFDIIFPLNRISSESLDFVYFYANFSFNLSNIMRSLLYLYLINLIILHFRLKIIYFPSSIQELYRVEIV